VAVAKHPPSKNLAIRNVVFQKTTSKKKGKGKKVSQNDDASGHQKAVVTSLTSEKRQRRLKQKNRCAFFSAYSLRDKYVTTQQSQ